MKILNWIDYIFIFTIFIPEIFKGQSGEVHYIYLFLEIIRLGGSLVLLVKYLSQRKYSITFVIGIAFHLIILISSIMNKAKMDVYKTWINVFLPNMGIICYVEKILKKEGVCGLKKIKVVLQTLVVINLVFCVAYPQGVYSSTMINTVNGVSRHIYTYFLGVKNRVIMWILPMIMLFNMTKIEKERKNFQHYLFLILSMVQLVICKSHTSIIAVVSFYILCFIFENNKVIVLTLKRIIFIYIALNILILKYKIQNIFSYLIIQIMNKNLYLQGRTFIWEKAIELVKEQKIWGYGNAKNGTIIPWNGYVWYSHNLLLDILIQGGIVGGIVLGILFIYLIRQENINFNNIQIIQSLNITICAFLLVGLFESYLNYPQFFMLLAIKEATLDRRYYLKI